MWTQALIVQVTRFKGNSVPYPNILTIHEYYAHVSLVPSILSHAESLVWLYVARSGCGQSDYRMVPPQVCLEKSCDSDLKEPDRPSSECFSVLEPSARWNAQLCIHKL